MMRPPHILFPISLLLLFAAGVLLLNVAQFEAKLVTAGPVWGAVVAMGLLAIPGLGPAIWKGIRRLTSLTPGGRFWGAAIVGVGSIVVLTGIELALERPWVMVWHDEYQFHLQSQLLARFRLWMPPHELASFFDTFYVLTSPVYAPQSFPGAALLFVPTVWLSLPTWLMPLLVTGITCGLLWWVLSELIDPACATMGLIILLCSFGFQRVATMYMAQMPLLMLGLVAVVALLRWRQATSLRWAALIGGSLGWAAVTRPLDAACYGAIVAVGMLPTFKCMRWADRAKSAGIVVVAATPFLLLQIIFNIGVTGSATQTPFALYNQQDQPALAYGTSGDLTRRPASTVPQKQRFYDAFTVRFVQYHNHPDQTPLILWRNRVNVMLPMLTPTVMLLPLLAVGLLGLSTGRRWLVFSLLPLFAASYHLYPIFLFHYILFAMPAVILLYALVPNVVGLAFGEKRSKLARSIVLLGMSGMAIGAQIDRARYELPDERKTERLAIDRLLDQVTEPAIVLFTAPSDRESLHLEVVYNNDVAWPDDAPVIRAHDRGQQNIELYRYYARTAPDRAVWRLDRERMTIQKIGKVRELASGVIAP